MYCGWLVTLVLTRVSISLRSYLILHRTDPPNRREQSKGGGFELLAFYYIQLKGCPITSVRNTSFV